MRLLPTVITVAIVLATGCTNSQKQNAHTSKITELEKIQLVTLNNEPVDWTQYKGKVIFVNFWATWCKPCIEEMPTIRNAMDALKGQEIEFLFASDETEEQIAGFEGKHNYDFNYVKTNSLEELGIMGLPTTILFDKTGKLVFNEMGFRRWDDTSNLELLSRIINEE